MFKKSNPELSNNDSNKHRNGNILSFIKSSRHAGNSEENLDTSVKQPIYYQGQNKTRTIGRRIQNLKLSDGNYKEDTSYHFEPGDHISHRYETLRSLGQGSFGVVVDCFDHKEKKRCAIKVVRRDIRFTTQAHDEIAILERLKKFNPEGAISSNNYPIVFLLSHFMFRDRMCLSFELLGCSLYDLIKDKKNQGLPRDRVRRLMSSVLEGLCFIKKAGILHCDLKPENVLLVTKQGEEETNETRDLVKIIDFGSSCLLNQQCYTYIQSRFYRAPEVIFRVAYSQPIDMWSFGCLIFEMINGNPLFPGEDESDQVACMIEKLGMPPTQMIKPARSFSRYFYDSDPGTKVSTAKQKETLSVVPKYCTLHVNPDRTIELRANFSKRNRRLRKPPGEVPVMLALKSTVSRSTGKYIETTPTKAEEVDNVHAAKLIEACLTWQPERRLVPEAAKSFSWFTYRSNALLLIKKAKNTPVKQPTPPQLTRLVPAPVNEVSVATDSSSNTSSIRENPKRKITLTKKEQPPLVNPEEPVPKNGYELRKQPVTGKNSDTFSNASPASLSAEINKQEDRVIYARAHPAPKPMINNSERKFTKKKSPPSDVSLRSTTSSISDGIGKENEHYSRKTAAVSDKYVNSTTKARKRNQSEGPKRHSQPIKTEFLPGNIRFNGISDHTITCKTATMESPEEGSPLSGRNAPITLSSTTNHDNNSYQDSSRSPPVRHEAPPHAQRKQYTSTLPLPNNKERPILTMVRSNGEFKNALQKSATAKILSTEDSTVPTTKDSAELKNISIREIIYRPDPTSEIDQMPFVRNDKSLCKTSVPQIHQDLRKRNIHLNKRSSTSSINEDETSTITLNGSIRSQNTIYANGLMQKPYLEPNSNDPFKSSSVSPSSPKVNRIVLKTIHRKVLN